MINSHKFFTTTHSKLKFDTILSVSSMRLELVLDFDGIVTKGGFSFNMFSIKFISASQTLKAKVSRFLFLALPLYNIHIIINEYNI